MFRMLSFFDLADGVDVDDFERALAPFCHHMIDAGLLHSRGLVGKRTDDTPMDTDASRSQQYFFVSTFVDQSQCDASYDYIKKGEEPCASLHTAMRSKMQNGVFSCWGDPTDAVPSTPT